MIHWTMGILIFGASDKIIEGHTEAYCIAKLERLVGPLGPLPNNMRQDSCRGVRDSGSAEVLGNGASGQWTDHH